MRSLILVPLLLLFSLLQSQQNLFDVMQRLKRLRSLIHTIEEEVEGQNNPGEIEADVVDPVVEELGAGVGDAGELVVEIVGEVVEGYAVEVGGAEDGLEEVAGEVGFDDGEVGEPGEGTPEELRGSASARTRVGLRQHEHLLR